MEGGVVLTALRASSFGENRILAASNECVAAHTQDLPEDRLRDVCACQKTAALSASFASSKCSAAASHPVNHRKVPLLDIEQENETSLPAKTDTLPQTSQIAKVNPKPQILTRLKFFYWEPPRSRGHTIPSYVLVTTLAGMKISKEVHVPLPLAIWWLKQWKSRKLDWFFRSLMLRERKAWSPGTREGLLKRDFTNADNLSRCLRGETISDHRQTHTMPMPAYLHMLLHTFIHTYIPLG